MAKRVPRSERTKEARITTLVPETHVPRPKPTRPTEQAREFSIASARLMAEDHCEDVIILDLVGISPICDYFVIGTGTSDRQVRAVADNIEKMAAEKGDKPYGVAGYQEGTWIVVDFVDVVIHLFDAERRTYYDLDSLWGDREKISWNDSKS
jgi:ribosome-associated protein